MISPIDRMKPPDLKSFSTKTKTDWKKLASAQMKGADPLDVFSQEYEGISIEPFYDISDLEGLDDLQNFFSKQSFRWKLYQSIEAGEENEANQNALEALEGGCDGVVFKLKNEQRSIDRLLKGIRPDICDISFIGDENSGLIKNNFNAKLSGFDTHLPTTHYCRLRSPIESLIDCVKNSGEKNHIVRHATGDFFFQIASLRALRYLHEKIHQKDAFQLHIHTIIFPHVNEDYQWFTNVTNGLASILGGSSSICFHSVNGNSRIGRNVGNLIREESDIEYYEDQCNGSYYVELLTHKIIKHCISLYK